MTQAVLKLRFIPYNARLQDARKEKRWRLKDVALLVGIAESYLGNIERLTCIPSDVVMTEIADAFQLPREYLFPQSLLEAQREGLFDHRIAELEEQQVIRLAEGRRAHLLPPALTDEEMLHEVDQVFLKKEIAEILDTLKPREKRIIELRFGLKDGISRTLEEVGKEFGVTRDRIRQIETKALRKLRHPSRSRKLKDFLD